MVNQYIDEEEETLEGNDLIKDLRRQIKALSKDKTELTSELTTIKGTVREQSVAEVLTAKGVNAKVAKLIPADVVGEEAIVKWLAEYSFTSTTEGDGTQSTKPNLSAEAIAETKRLQALGNSGQSPAKLNDLAAKVANATGAELDALLKEATQYLL